MRAGRARPEFAKGSKRACECLLLVGGLLIATLPGCQHQNHHANELMRQAASQFSFPQTKRDEVELLLDSTASMRGFAFAAVKNEQTPVGSWASIFVGIDSLSQNIHLSRFGGRVEAHAGQLALFPMAVGSQKVDPIGQARLDSRWRSRSCGGKSLSGRSVVSAIDSLFSERETCLGLAFDQATREPSDRALRIVLTDSEQAAGDESEGCPLGNNPTPVQERLYGWVHSRLRFGAIGLFRLPYEAWRVDAPTRDYCHCANRNLFLYLLGPSARTVEESYANIANRWHGAASDIAYLPLAPRPAAQYQLKMIIPRTPAGDVPASIEGAQQSLEPESGHLPVFFLRLDDQKAVVRFSLTKVAFRPAGIRVLPGGATPLPLSSDLDWSDQPTLVEITPPTKDSQPRLLRLASGTGAVEFVRLPESAGQDKVAHVREARFFSDERRIAEADMSDLQLTGSWEVRRRPGAKKNACELYLFELNAHGDKLVERLIAATPLLQSPERACSGLDSIAAQVRHVYQETPVARFLLHVDS